MARFSGEICSGTLTDGCRFLERKENHCMANVFERVQAERKYNQFVKGVQSIVGLVETLNGPGPFTIFVPTDAAFARLSDDKRANLFADPEKLAKVMKYHVVPGLYRADDMLDRIFLKTLEGARLRVWADIYVTPLDIEEVDTNTDALNYIARQTVSTEVRESVTINGGHVLEANVMADNGILHVIDKVLIPPFTFPPPKPFK
jgi:uncharacterized surface protein with fasciclin (FAS1) repeats